MRFRRHTTSGSAMRDEWTSGSVHLVVCSPPFGLNAIETEGQLGHIGDGRHCGPAPRVFRNAVEGLGRRAIESASSESRECHLGCPADRGPTDDGAEGRRQVHRYDLCSGRVEKGVRQLRGSPCSWQGELGQGQAPHRRRREHPQRWHACAEGLCRSGARWNDAFGYGSPRHWKHQLHA